MLVYVVVARPYKSRVTFLLSIFNYLCMLALMSLMLLFQTGLQRSSKDTFGSIMTLILITNFMVNMLVVVLFMLVEAIKTLGKCCCKRARLKR